MAITALGSGTQTATIGTEHFVQDVAVAGVFTFHVDKNAMAAGDVLELRAYQMVLAGGTSRVIAISTVYSVPTSWDLIEFLGPLSNELTDSTALRFSILQRFGTGRAFPWKVLRHN